MIEYKLVIVGGAGVGKTSLTVQFVQNHFSGVYDPTIEDCYRRAAHIDDESCVVDVLDTVADVTMIKSSWIRTGEGFMIAYSIAAQSSFEEIAGYRDVILGVKKNDKVPIVLCGNKCDLEEYRQVDTQEGKDRAISWGNCPFFETSAKNGINVEKAFFEVVREVWGGRREEEGRKRNCVLL